MVADAFTTTARRTIPSSTVTANHYMLSTMLETYIETYNDSFVPNDSELATSIWNWDRKHRGQEASFTWTRDGLVLVDSISKQFQTPGMYYNDLVQEGMMALMHAMTTCPTEETFDDYAGRCITHSLSELLKARQIQLPQMSVESTIMEIIKTDAVAQFLDDYKVDLRDEAYLEDDFEGEDLMWIRQEQIAGPLRDMIPDVGAESDEMRQDVDGFLSKWLSDAEMQLIRLRFGLDDGRRMPLKEIGTIFGVSQLRIKQMEDAALEKLLTASYSFQQALGGYLEDDGDEMLCQY
jgi:RNA polymerase sigma factor (sigma-70 family)